MNRNKQVLFNAVGCLMIGLFAGLLYADSVIPMRNAALHFLGEHDENTYKFVSIEQTHWKSLKEVYEAGKQDVNSNLYENWSIRINYVTEIVTISFTRKGDSGIGNIANGKKVTYTYFKNNHQIYLITRTERKKRGD